MSTHKLGRLLIVDDEIELTTALCDGLKKRGYEATGVTSGRDGLEAMRNGSFDLLLTDLMMPDLDGISLLRLAIQIDPHIIGIIMTGQGTVQTAVEAMQIGAYDYILKPFKLDKLLPVLTRALEVRRLRLDNVQLRETLAIYELCQAIAHTLDVDTLLSKTADAVLQQLEADEVSILLPTKEGEELYVATVRGERPERIPGGRIPLAQGIASWLAQHKEFFPFEGANVDSRSIATHQGKVLGTSLSMPMLVGGKLLGMFNVTNRRPRPFTLGQVKGLSILAGTAAAAFESVGLYTQVRQAEEKYRSIFENSIEGIFQINTGGRFIIANPALVRMLGYESSAELMESVTDIECRFFVSSEQCTQFRRLIEGQGSVAGFEFEACCKDGSIVWVSMNARCVRDSSGMPLYYEGMVEDISERKRAEEEVKAYAAKLERNNRELQDFAFIASHDLQEPLRKIQTFANMLVDRQKECLDARGLDFMERIEKAANRMSALLRSLLTYSRTGTAQLNCSPIDLTQVAKDAINDLEVLIHEAKGRIELGELPTVEADVSLLRQLIHNMIENAIKYQKESEPPVIKIYGNVEETTCRLVIEDNGIGFDENYCHKIFKPFERLHGKYSPYKGTGMGLAICRKIADLHGGDITARSVPGEGATFIVTLPRKQQTRI